MTIFINTGVNKSSNFVHKSPVYNFGLGLEDNGLGKGLGDLVSISVEFASFKRSSKPLLCVVDGERGSPDS